MSKPDFKNEPWRWNRWYASEYDSDAVNIADDFYTLDKECDYALLSAQWMIKNKNGKALDEVFSVAEILAASKKDGFKADVLALVIDANWRSYVRWKLNDAPIILPPPPAPPPVVVEEPKLPEIKLPQEKKNPSPALVKFSVYFGMIATVAGAISWFVPVLKPWLLAIVPIVETVLKLFGV